MSNTSKPHPLPYIHGLKPPAASVILTPQLLPQALTRMALTAGRKFSVMSLDEATLYELAQRLTAKTANRQDVLKWINSLGIMRVSKSALYRFADALVKSCFDVMHAMIHPHLNEPAVLTESEAAERLKVKKKDVIALIESDQLTARRIGNGWRIPTRAFRAFLDGDNASLNARQTPSDSPPKG